MSLKKAIKSSVSYDAVDAATAYFHVEPIGHTREEIERHMMLFGNPPDDGPLPALLTTPPEKT